MAYYILKSYKLKFDPLAILNLFSHYRGCFFLDSSLNSQASGRYSFLGIEPAFKLESKNKNSFEKIREILEQGKVHTCPSNPPFLGGAVGYLAYDSGLGVPDYFFGVYNHLVIIDHWKKLLSICSIGFPEKNYFLSKALAESNFKKLYRLLIQASENKDNNVDNRCFEANRGLQSNFQKEDYITAVKKAKEYIRRGDIYQVNLSQRFEIRNSLPAIELYRRLRRISPAPFSAYFATDSFQILSSSPERFLSVRGDKVITCPMKGTRPRSKNRKRDARLKKELLASNKDKAELVMIVDLERNDLGRVCSYNSIKVNAPRVLETYNTVYQTTATIEGKLYHNKDRLDLLQACFPGGSITGCPKIRAMQIIQELEPTKRSVYTGALGYLSFCGNMDFNILIRTILKKGKQLYFSAGGGIVADSDPEREYQETLVKAKAIREAVNARRI